ncbi:MAG: pectinesterase family protein [Lachnospira sp.]
MITVALDGSGDYTSVQEAVRSIKNNSDNKTIFIKNGIYKERVEITVDNITLIGESVDGVKITEGYYALMPMDDGNKRGTFRSYTFFVNADNFSARNITFENSSGFGTKVGQAVAVYAEGDHVSFKNCKMYGHQDTLFTGPLPLKEREPGGFRGPTEFAERRLCRQLYEDCFICGEIDFIFGSATCYFKNCTLYALCRNTEINSYLTAPSTYEWQKYGYVFDNCTLTGNCPPKSVSLGRPWRKYAKCVYLNCTYSDQIIDGGFSDWSSPDEHNTVFFAEYNGKGDGYKPDLREPFVKELSDSEATAYTEEEVLNLPW